jgi:hypothetical protein
MKHSERRPEGVYWQALPTDPSGELKSWIP